MKTSIPRKWNHQKVSGWLMTKSGDGIPVAWDGDKFTRPNGKPVKLPTFLRQEMPQIPLIGEIQAVEGIRSPLANLIKAGSRNLVFVVMDAPGDDPFDARRQSIKRLTLPTHAKPARYVLCAGIQHMKDYAGSGTVTIRNPSAPSVDGDDRNTLTFTIPRQDQPA